MLGVSVIVPPVNMLRMFARQAFATFVLLSLLQASFAIDDTGCGTTKNCVRYPENCVLTDSTCMFFSFILNPSTSMFTMELRGSTGGGTNYVAVAFAPASQMANAELYYCTGSTLGSGSINGRFGQPSQDGSLVTGVASTLTETNGGVAECTFTRTLIITRDVNSASTTFNMDTTEYFILLAHGAFTAGNLVQHGGLPARFNFPTQTNFKFQPSSTATTTTVATTTTPATTTVAGSGNDFLSGCATTKTCFRHPSTCTPGNSDCMFASWTYVPASNTYRFELVGGGAGKYMAIAFSVDQVMQDDDLYYCTDSTFASGTIVTFHALPNTLSSLEGASDTSQTLDGGVLSCTFTRQASVTKTIGSGSFNFNFTSHQYFVFVATGDFSGGMSYHGVNRAFSQLANNFSELSDVTGSGSSPAKRNMVKAHASLMLLAWLTCASIGVMIARHFKPLWHNDTCFGGKIWFQLHRSLMISAVVATILAFILIFSSVEGYSADAGAHPIIGIIVTCLAILNPIMAIFRPHPGTPNRYLFNWGHWFVGSAARILGIAAIFLGVDLAALDLPEWDTWALVGFVCFHVLVEILLEILSAYYGHIDSYKKKKTEENIPMGDDNLVGKDRPPKGAGVKYFILVVYSIGNLAFVFTFIAFISMQD